MKIQLRKTKRRIQNILPDNPGPAHYNPDLIKNDYKKSSFQLSLTNRNLFKINQGPDPASYKITDNIDKRLDKIKTQYQKKKNYIKEKTLNTSKSDKNILIYQNEIQQNHHLKELLSL